MTPAKHAKMLDGFERFSQRIARRYAEVYDCLAANRFEEAQALLADLGMSHARTSLSLRNLLVREGMLEADK